jgi:hypothetical protein
LERGDWRAYGWKGRAGHGKQSLYVNALPGFHLGGVKDWLQRNVTVEQAEAENKVTDDRLGPVPFDFCNGAWLALLAQMQPEDALWEFSSPLESWQMLCGRAGIALVRGGEVVASFVTERN